MPDFNQNLIPLAIVTAGTVLAILLLCSLVGWFMRRPILEGVAIGFLYIASASDMALYLSRGLSLSLNIFVIISLVFLFLLIAGTRKFIFTKPYPGRSTGFHTWVVVFGVAFIIGGVRLLTPFPQAAYSLFQGYNPLYLQASGEFGSFISILDTSIGPGFMGSAGLYPVDSLGLPALFYVVTGINAQTLVLATSISTVIAAFSILAFGLRRSPLSLIGFGLLFLFFFRYAHYFRTPLADNAIDQMTYLAGAVAIYFLACGEAGRIARVGSAIMMAPAVLARPSGAIYSALFALNGFWADFKQGVLRSTIWSWLFFAMVLGSMTFREIIMVFQGGIFGARPGVMQLFPRSFSKSFWGILHDWGMVPDARMFEFSIPMLSFSALVLVCVLYIRRQKIADKPRLTLMLLAPLLVLIAPMLVELLTGFRKYSYGSKLYFVTLFLFPWYPFWLLSHFKKWQWWPSFAARGFKFTSVAAGVVIFGVILIKNDYIEKRYVTAVNTYHVNEPDSRMAKLLRQKYSETKIRDIVKTPIVYFYYEPGAGLRFYLGGNFFKDFDFWSDGFQLRLEKADSLEDVLKDLNYPSLYFTHKDTIAVASKWVPSVAWKKFETEIRKIDKQPYVRDIINDGDFKFVVTGPKKLQN